MVFHMAFMKGNAIHHQMSVLHGTAIDGKSGAENGTGHVHKIHKCVGHGPNVAFRGGIEGGTILEIELPCTLVKKKPGCPQAVIHCLCCFLCPGF